MRKLFILAVLLLSAAGCCKGHVSADAISGSIQDVTKRHDAMLDGTLDPKAISAEDKATFKRSAHVLNLLVEEAKK